MQRNMSARRAAAVASLVTFMGLLPVSEAASSLRSYHTRHAANEQAIDNATLLMYEKQPTALSANFFRNQMPYQTAQQTTLASQHAPAAGSCHPKCEWSCGTADCDETCDPVCAPPQCETACPPINAATCRHACEAPKCAIVCPTAHCEHGGCPGCKTVCAPPKCQTLCAEDCESKCAEPQCTWKCNPGKCEKPKCSLSCGGAAMCSFDKDVNMRPDWKGGMNTISSGLAAFDPHTLGVATVVAGAPAAAPAASPVASPAASPAGVVQPLIR